MQKVSIETVKEIIKIMDEMNGTDYNDRIDWNNPNNIPDFLKKEHDFNQSSDDWDSRKYGADEKYVQPAPQIIQEQFNNLKK